MRGIADGVVAAALVAALAGCAGGGAGGRAMVERAAGADEVPVRFAYRGLAGARPVYRAADDSRRGFAVRRATFVGRDEFAIFDVISTAGQSAMPPEATSLWVRRMVERDDAIEWGPAGDVQGGPRQTGTGWQTFRMGDREAACVGVQRSLGGQRATGGAAGDQGQLMVVGLYCRRGQEQIGVEEARAVAAALQA